MNLATLLQKAALSWGDRPALAHGKMIVSNYRQSADRVARLATGLRDKLGLKTSDRVALAMKNSPEYSDILFAAWHAGCVAVPMNSKLHENEFAYMLEHAGAKACFVTDDLEGTIEKAAAQTSDEVKIINIAGGTFAELHSPTAIPVAEVDADDVAWLFYTSGTTGKPKGAMLTHRNLLAMTIGYYGDVDYLGEEDTLLHAAPMSHGSGLYILPYVAKGACQLIPESGGFEPAEVLDLLGAYPLVGCFLAPTMVTRLINAPEFAGANTSNLKTIVYGGGPMYVEDCLKALEALGPKLVQIYGQGESPMTITALSRQMHLDTAHPRYLDRLSSVGTARTDLEVRIVDADGAAVPAGEMGEITVRGDVVMKGYWQNTEASDETLKGGWLHTGDMGVLDEDGYLTLRDRSKDVIISGGSNIYPREVEEALLKHPDVFEVSVVGGPHPDWGEAVVAFVVARDSSAPAEAELDALCLENIARFKRPKRYVFIDALPKNNYGKVLKTALREKLTELEAATH